METTRFCHIFIGKGDTVFEFWGCSLYIIVVAGWRGVRMEVARTGRCLLPWPQGERSRGGSIANLRLEGEGLNCSETPDDSSSSLFLACRCRDQLRQGRNKDSFRNLPWILIFLSFSPFPPLLIQCPLTTPTPGQVCPALLAEQPRTVTVASVGF